MKTITLLAILIAGCSTTPPNPIKGGTDSTVTVSYYEVTMAEAIAAAENHCQKYGKHAQFAGKEDFFVFYNCV